MTPHLFEISTSTHYGRMVMVDDETVVLFGNMEEALTSSDTAILGRAGATDRQQEETNPCTGRKDGEEIFIIDGTRTTGMRPRTTSRTFTASNSSTASMLSHGVEPEGAGLAEGEVRPIWRRAMYKDLFVDGYDDMAICNRPI